MNPTPIVTPTAEDKKWQLAIEYLENLPDDARQMLKAFVASREQSARIEVAERMVKCAEEVPLSTNPDPYTGKALTQDAIVNALRSETERIK